MRIGERKSWDSKPNLNERENVYVGFWIIWDERGIERVGGWGDAFRTPDKRCCCACTPLLNMNQQIVPNREEKRLLNCDDNHQIEGEGWWKSISEEAS